MTRIHLYGGQRSFLKKSLMPTAEADEVSSLAERRLPERPLLNSDPECFGSHSDWKIA